MEDNGRDRLVVCVNDEVFAMDGLLDDGPADMRTLIATRPDWRNELHFDGAAPLDATKLRWRPPVAPSKLICVGTNYRDHVVEMERVAGVTLRPEPFPFAFLKPAATTLIGSGTPVRHPTHGRKLDWEAELAIVIGDPALATDDDPLAGVFGYSILNDLSLRDFLPFPHALGLDALSAKGFDGAAPMGPWITPAADVADPQDLSVRLRVNGELMQDSSTAKMIFGLREIVAHFARIITLEPGDVIATGTPAGVGAARQPQRFLEAGDVVEVTIGDLGLLTTAIHPPEVSA